MGLYIVSNNSQLSTTPISPSSTTSSTQLFFTVICFPGQHAHPTHIAAIMSFKKLYFIDLPLEIHFQVNHSLL